MPKDEATTARLGRHPLASPPATHRLFCRGSIGGFLRRHRTTEFEGLVEIVGEARCSLAAITEIDAILAGQVPESDAEGAELDSSAIKSWQSHITNITQLLNDIHKALRQLWDIFFVLISSMWRYFMRLLLSYAMIIAVGLYLFSPLAAHAAPPGDIQMLPPVDFSNAPCSGNKAGILYWDGTTAIKCIPDINGDANGNLGIGTATPNSSLDLSNKTDAVSMPAGTTAQEPATPKVGMTRFNTDIAKLEFWNGSQWVPIATSHPQVQTVYALMPFSTTANYLDCPAGWNNLGCSSVEVPSGQASCQVTPGEIDPGTGLSSCAQAGCGQVNPADTGYYTAANCVQF